MEVYIPKVVFLLIFTFFSISDGLLLYPPRYQPELDRLSLEKYIADDYLFSMHINCLLYDGPCDPVGRWMKPRMASYFLSSCILCTPNQERESTQFMTWLYENHPQLFRIGIAKYLDANGISLPPNSKFREQMDKMNVPKVAISGESSSIEQQDTSKDKRVVVRPISSRSDRESETKVHDSSPPPDESLMTSDDEQEIVTEATTVVSVNDDDEGVVVSSLEEEVEDDEETRFEKVPTIPLEEAEVPQLQATTASARKNKFAAAMSFAPNRKKDNNSPRPIVQKIPSQSHPHQIEDDEADEQMMDFKFYL